MSKMKAAQKPAIFGGYDFAEEESLSAMAMDIGKTVHTLLRLSPYQCEDIQTDELAAAGHLLQWAQEYLAWHGFQGGREEQKEWQGLRRACRTQRRVGRSSQKEG